MFVVRHFLPARMIRILKSIADCRKFSTKGCGFVPTMGALHRGHTSLIKESAKSNPITVVSIFVNPTQFGPNEDLSKYPRQLAQDLELAEEAGAVAAFVPDASTIYSDEVATIRVEQVTRYFEGERRPGHFEGVATVVSKLFNIIEPSTAYFGLKDLQQCAVIDAMVSALFMPIQLEFRPTVREEDGLALSSRNVYLTHEQRSIAPQLYQELLYSKELVLQGKALDAARERLASNGWEIDYLELIDRKTFSKSNKIDKSSAIVAAAKLGSVRLIDNIINILD